MTALNVWLFCMALWAAILATTPVRDGKQVGFFSFVASMVLSPFFILFHLYYLFKMVTDPVGALDLKHKIEAFSERCEKNLEELDGEESCNVCPPCECEKDDCGCLCTCPEEVE
jgi:hypothetical protein